MFVRHSGKWLVSDFGRHWHTNCIDTTLPGEVSWYTQSKSVQNMIHQDSDITKVTFSGPSSSRQAALARTLSCEDGDGPATVPTFLLNELLSKLYGVVGRHPCAECCSHDGVVLAPDVRGSQALVCDACASLSPVQRDYAITSQERKLLVAGAR